jgi:Flp pilus assembly protein TadG
MRRPMRQSRRGAVLPLVAICMLGMMGLVALAIDIGMVAVARTQCQNAADAAAMAGARTINGDAAANYNYAAVPGNAMLAAIANRVLDAYVLADPSNMVMLNSYTYQSGQVTIETGAYAYQYNDANPAKEGFQLQFPRAASEPYSAVRATVNVPGDYAFGRIFGLSTFNTGATAVAVHRPRDIIIVLDLSGSMRFQSLPGVPTSGGLAMPGEQQRPRVVSLNPDTAFPQFGHYSNVAGAALQGTTSYWTTTNELAELSNISITSNSGPPVIEDFYQNGYGVAAGPGNRAFFRAPNTQDKAPGGYDYLKINNNTGASYATNVVDVVGKTTWDQNFETKGYDQYQAAKPAFYTEGPGYWGKTFFIWPPDPRGATGDANDAKNHANNGAKDWRQRFFFKVNTATGILGWLDHNTILFDAAGKPSTNTTLNPIPILKRPGSATTVTENGVSVSYTYRINYAAIFDWLRNQDPKPFPTQLRAGRIKYYDAIPNPSDTTLNNRFWTTATLPNLNERFWKDYVDFVLGLKGTGAGSYTNVQSGVPLTALIGNGDFFSWGTRQLSQKPDPWSVSAYQSGSINNSGGYAAGYAADVMVKGLSSVPLAGDYVYIGSDRTPYRVSQAASLTSLRLDRPLASAAAQGTSLKFIRERFMNYSDNPYRPRHQFWFGPMTFVDWLGNYNTNHLWWPGNVHEAQAWAAKVGIQTAIDDIKNNHPVDFIALAFFSNPLTSNLSGGHHNRPVVPLSRSYQQLKDSLWFPPSTIFGSAVEITPYDPDFQLVPRANGGTAPGMGLMLAYNMLSSSANNLRFYSQPQPRYWGHAGGVGRKGASRVVIFETDGVPNSRAYAAMSGSGGDSYYKIRLRNPDRYQDGSNVEWPTSGGINLAEVYDVVKQICKLETDNPAGYSTSRRPALVHPIGYGSLFDPNNPSGAQTSALNFMQTVAFYGNTATTTNGGDFPDSRRIYGDNDQRIERMRQAFTDIMQSGVQVTLIE